MMLETAFIHLRAMKLSNLIAILGAFILFGCNDTPKETKTNASEQETTAPKQTVEFKGYGSELHRPRFHFTPAKNWMHSPAALITENGRTDMFFQYNPKGRGYGFISWGHAYTTDWQNWIEDSIALMGMQDTMYFSGSVVNDVNNTSDLCEDEPCWAAIYTEHIRGISQTQHLAISEDQGKTWKPYKANPVLDPGRNEFRHPHVFWHERSRKWVMVVAVSDKKKLEIYNSPNLKEWELQSEFSSEQKSLYAWDEPALIEVPVEGEDKSKWVLFVSGDGANIGFYGTKYYVGDFDGKRFRQTESKDTPRYVDYGKDFFGAHFTYNPEPTMMAWAGIWTYVKDVPTRPWRGTMTIPRKLSLTKVNGVHELLQQPVLQYDTVPDREWIGDELNITDQEFDLAGNTEIDSRSCIIELSVDLTNAAELGLTVFKGQKAETHISYDVNNEELRIDRKKSGVLAGKKFASIETCQFPIEDNILKLSILLDHSILEVFAQDGYRVMTTQVFPPEDAKGLVLFGKGRPEVEYVKMWGKEREIASPSVAAN